MYILILTLVVLFNSGCNQITEPEEPLEYIKLEMELPIDNNGNYFFTYPSGETSSYTRVYAETNRRDGRIFWYSPNTFYYIMFGDTFTEPVVNYSTYATTFDNGKYHTQQLVYINQQHIGDTINIYGYYNDDIISNTRFIVK